METKDLSLFILSKIASDEILIEEQLQQLKSTRFRYFKRYSSSKESLKRKFILSKIFGAFIFGILPIIPLLTYFEVLDFINEGTIPIELVLFTGSLLFSMFFLFQFFNFFLMAMLNTMKILSGSVFEWFETLPISRAKLRKLILLTAIRSLDIPLIVVTFAFPIMMLIGTQNLFIFLICVGVSILDTILSFGLLLLFSERMNRILNINEFNSKKVRLIRLINLIIYIIIVIGSIFLIQWAFGSMETFFLLFGRSRSPSLVILILSMIPFPIAPGYFISSFISPLQIPFHIWYNIIIGFALFLILTWLITQQSIKGIRKTISSKSKKLKKIIVQDLGRIKKSVKIKIKSPVWAFIRKDFIISTGNLKNFLSIIMPIVIGFIFTFTYNITNIGGLTPFETDFVFNLFVIIGFNLFISGMIVHSLLDMEESGASVITSLPIIPRDQARAKLILMFLIQTITILTPSIMYIGSTVFLDSFFTALLGLPIVLLFQLIMFEIRVYFFGKSKKYFLVEEVFPEKKVIKWIFIFIMIYSLYFIFLSFAFFIYLAGGVIIMLASLFIIIVVGFFIVFLIMNKMFPIITPSEKNLINQLREGYQPWETKQSWISIFLLLILHFFLNSLIWFTPYPIFPHSLYSNQIFREIYKFLSILNINFIYVALLIIINQKVLGISRKQIFGQDFDNIGFKWKKFLSKRIIWSVISAYIIVTINIVIFSLLIANNMSQILSPYTGLSVILDFIYFYWQNLALGGIILTILLRNFKIKRVIIIYPLIISIYQIISLLIYISFTLPSEYYYSPSDIILVYVYLVSLMFFFTYFLLNTNRIIFGFTAAITVHIIVIILVLFVEIGIPFVVPLS
ncbi:MAG: hypothetical protein ACFE75_08340 [Candidatus Hodarchaeota archaeon]